MARDGRDSAFQVHPEVRLADAIAGYVRGEIYRGDSQRSTLTTLPGWFDGCARSSGCFMQ